MRFGYAGGSSGGGASDPWYTALRAGQAFWGGHHRGQSAAVFSHIQLLNPVASGKSATVYFFTGGATASGLYHVREYDTALTTLVQNGINCQSGGAGGVCEIRTMDNGAALGTLVTIIYAVSNAWLPVGNQWVFELGQGQGLVVAPGAVNVGVNAAWWWVEQ